MADVTDPTAVVQAFMGAMEKLDYDTGVQYVADDCRYQNMMMGEVVGPAGVRGLLEPFFAPVQENEFVVRNLVSAGNVVVLERLDRHRVGETWVELPVTGVFEVSGGKITAWRDYFDLATIRDGFAAIA